MSNRIETAIPASPHRTVEICGQRFFFPAKDHPCWVPYVRSVANQVNPVRLASAWLEKTPGVADETRKMLLEVAFEQLVENPEDPAAIAHVLGDPRNLIKMFSLGLSIANPEWSEREWAECISDLSITEFKAIRLVP